MQGGNMWGQYLNYVQGAVAVGNSLESYLLEDSHYAS